MGSEINDSNIKHNNSKEKIMKDSFIKDKVIVLLGNKGSQKNYFINFFINEKIIEPQKKVGVIIKNIGGFNLFFVYTSDFIGDAKTDDKIIEGLLDIIKPLSRINFIFLCKRQFDHKLSNSMIKTLKIFMNLYPSKKFLDHVIILKAYSPNADLTVAPTVYRGGYEGLEILEKNQEFKDFMINHNFDKPSIKNEYLLDTDFYEKNFTFLIEILNQIIKTYPVYKKIKEEIIIKIKEEKENDCTFINETKNLNLTITDFDGEKFEVSQTLENKKYNLDEIKNKYLIKFFQNEDYLDEIKEYLRMRVFYKSDFDLVKKLDEDKYFLIKDNIEEFEKYLGDIIEKYQNHQNVFLKNKNGFYKNNDEANKLSLYVVKYIYYLDGSLESKINLIERRKKEDNKKELNSLLEEEKEKNLKLEKENSDLKKQLEVKNELNLNKIKETKEYKEIENENKELKSQLSKFPFKEGEKIMSIIFMSLDERLHYSIICKNTDIFYTVLTELKENFPEYFEKDIIYILKGKKIDIKKTIEQNGIKNSDIIILSQIE